MIVQMETLVKMVNVYQDHRDVKAHKNVLLVKYAMMVNVWINAMITMIAPMEKFVKKMYV